MKAPWLKFALLLGVLFLASCRDNCESQCRERYWDGYRAGESSGYDRGYNAGHREGYSEGESDGYRSGYLGGTGALIGQGTLPIVGITILGLLFLITALTILRVFRKPLEDFVRQYGILMRSKLLLIQSQSEISKHQKLRDKRARIAAQTLALEAFLETETLICDLNLSTEYLFILRSVEERLYSCMMASFSDQSKHILSLMSDLKTNTTLLPKERKELAEILYSALQSETEKENDALIATKAESASKRKASEGYNSIRKSLTKAKRRRAAFLTILIVATGSISYLIGNSNLFPPLL